MDNTLRFQSPSSHAVPDAVVSSVAAAAASAVAAAACRSSAEIGTSALAVHSHRDVEAAHTRALVAEPAVALPLVRTVVATEQWADSAKKPAGHSYWLFPSDVVQAGRPHHQVIAVVGAGMGAAGIVALAQAAELATAVATVLALLEPPVAVVAVVVVAAAAAVVVVVATVAAAVAGVVAGDDIHLPSSP